jgi:hypothetical protein
MLIYSYSYMTAIAMFLLCHAEPVYPEFDEGKHCCKPGSSFLNILLVLVIPQFALMQKGEPKNGSKPQPLRASCRLRTATVITVLTIHVLRPKKHISVLLQLFHKVIAGQLLKCNMLHRYCTILVS